MDSSNTWNGSGFDETNFGMAVFICGSNTANPLKNITCISLQGLSFLLDFQSADTNAPAFSWCVVKLITGNSMENSFNN
jgi:hypothetical protein